MVREGLDDLGVERVVGVSFRYENRIQHDTKAVELGSLLRLSLASPKEAGATTHVHLYWHQMWPDGTVEVDVEACPRVSEKEMHINITAHCVVASRALDDVAPTTRVAHRLARLTFEELITPSFRERLKSGTAPRKEN